MVQMVFCVMLHRGLPLITYASRGGGGVNTNAYKCVQGGRGGLNMTKNTHFVRRFGSFHVNVQGAHAGLKSSLRP